MKHLKDIEQVLREDGRYPLEAVEFIREGLNYTVHHFHGDLAPDERRHVSGHQLCEGLRELALQKWGLMARSILEHWNITTTRDFGEIVFLLVDNDLMQKEPSDSIEDFDHVYEFSEAFDRDFTITFDS